MSCADQSTPDSAIQDAAAADMALDRSHITDATLAAIVESSDDAIISKSLDGIIGTWNAAAQRIFGYPADEIIGKSILLLVPPDRIAEEHSILTRLAQGRRVSSLETVRRTKSGREIQVSVTSSPIRDSKGRIVGASKIARDITERKQSEAAQRDQQTLLEHLSRLNTMGEMATGLAHELNQPLASILTYAAVSLELLGSENPPLSRINSALKQVLSEARRTGDIIRRLREFVQRRAPAREPMDINEKITGAVHLLHHDLNRAEIKVRLDLNQNLPILSADPVQFVQVMVNLLRNARDAMIDANAAGKDLLIRSSADARQVLVQVIDRGCGVTEEQLKSVFDRFFSTKTAGLGMGLAISKTIVESHGGQLTGALNSNGEGMTFSIMLPVDSGKEQ
jgi:two-component system sensor kinase FixL